LTPLLTLIRPDFQKKRWSLPAPVRIEDPGIRTEFAAALEGRVVDRPARSQHENEQVGVHAIARDITRQKEAEDKLRQSEPDTDRSFRVLRIS
jgi:hypothetical protein